MKNLSYLLIALISGFVPYFTYVENKKYPHKELIDWIDSGNLLDSNGLAEVDDSSIIKILQDIVRYNEYKSDSFTSEFFKSRHICRDSANYFHKIYRDRHLALSSIDNQVIVDYRMDLDPTEAVLFELDLILGAVITAFPNVNLYDLPKWKNKGFFVYPSNYGANGHLQSNIAIDNYKSSSIIQIAEDKTPNTPNEWQVIPDMIYNFGDLKPPKVITNEQILGTVHSGFNCPDR